MSERRREAPKTSVCVAKTNSFHCDYMTAEGVDAPGMDKVVAEVV
jgi:hypothetical protein